MDKENKRQQGNQGRKPVKHDGRHHKKYQETGYYPDSIGNHDGKRDKQMREPAFFNKCFIIQQTGDRLQQGIAKKLQTNTALSK